MVAAVPAWFGTWLGSSHQIGNAVVVDVVVFLRRVKVPHSLVVARLGIELLEVEDRTVAAVVARTDAAAAAAAAAAEAEDGTAVALLAREVLVICLSTYIISYCRTMRANRTGKVLTLRRAIWRLIGHRDRFFSIIFKPNLPSRYFCLPSNVFKCLTELGTMIFWTFHLVQLLSRFCTNACRSKNFMGL